MILHILIFVCANHFLTGPLPDRERKPTIFGKEHIMKRTVRNWVLFAALALFILLAGAAGAQDVDVSTMSNEELMVLLQSIMERLSEDSTGAEAVTTVSADDTPAQVTEEEAETFSVYTNKKLIVEALPGYYFIRKPTGGNDVDGSSNSGSTGSNDTITMEFHYGDYTFTVDVPTEDFGDIGIPTNVWNGLP